MRTLEALVFSESVMLPSPAAEPTELTDSSTRGELESEKSDESRGDLRGDL